MKDQQRTRVKREVPNNDQKIMRERWSVFSGDRGGAKRQGLEKAHKPKSGKKSKVLSNLRRETVRVKREVLPETHLKEGKASEEETHRAYTLIFLVSGGKREQPKKNRKGR